MKLIELAVGRPVAVLAVVLLAMLMGWLALVTIPIQLTPDVRKPLMIVQTVWRGASPAEIEREIVMRQEEALKGLEGLERMESRSNRGRAFVVLEFNVSADPNRSILLINNRLSQVTGMPAEANEPEIRTRDTDDNPIAWFSVKTVPGNTRPISAYGDFIDDTIRDRLERITGVALVNVWGGNRQEIRVIVDPRRLAHYRLTISELSDALRGTNVNLTAGDVEEGKREYTVRTESELNTEARVRDVVLRTQRDPDTGRVFRVTVGDVADVEYGYKRYDSRIRDRGEPAVMVNVVRDTGANVIEVMRQIKAVTAELNENILPSAGIVMQQVHDDTIYINSAIGLVTQNIWVGGTLAAIVLLLFLRSFGATATVALAIPVSIIGSFVAMAALGRSINVISLAGIAFAVGMVVDGAIVVLENIYRHREAGRSRAEGAVRGAVEVWGAILASAVTTVVVFAPILVMDLVVGQLFRDIAIALSVAVLLSLIVSITVVPTLANRLLGDDTHLLAERRRIPVVDPAARTFVRGVTGFTSYSVGNRAVGTAVIVLVCGAAGLSTWLFLPKLSYLPEGNNNLVVAAASTPPGYNLQALGEIATKIEDEMRPYWAQPGEKVDPDGPVRMERFWFVTRSLSTFVGASATDPKRSRELVPILQRAVFSEPGTFGFVRQTSLFGRGFGGSSVIDLDITGPELEDLLEIARDAVSLAEQELPRSEGNQIRPRPGLELGAPEVRVVPDLLRLADVGLTARDLGVTLDVFNDGMRVAEVTRGARRIDLTLTGPHRNVQSTQGIGNLPVVTRSGHILPASSLAKIEVTEGPIQIRHLERERTVSVSISPSPAVPLESAIETVQQKVIEPLTAQGLPPGVRLSLSGTADELSRTWEAMLFNLVIAILVVYLVMAILFESFIFPFIIMFSVPLATAGGIGGLALLNLMTFQPLDMLTLLGFVILVGTVVNNAILLVHQTLYQVRSEGLLPYDAIMTATKNRIRPIFMSTLTSMAGMLPLVLTPGAGSELYRGLGSVVVGGLALSAVLTLLIIPPLLSFTSPLLRRQRGSMMEPAIEAVPVASPAE